MKNIGHFLTYLQKVAEGKRMDAGYSGSHTDGGASHLEDTIAAYHSGAMGVIPGMWETYYRRFLKENDEEYEDYLRLKKKFEE